MRLVWFGTAACWLAVAAAAAGQIVEVGSGSYAVSLPPGARRPQATIYRTENAAGPMPTNDWWSSVAWMEFSERQYPHPLAVQAVRSGLAVYYPGTNITANKAAIFGFMPAGTGEDLVLGHWAAGEFPDARVDGFSDWFVRVAFAAGDSRMEVSYGHGSPFVYALYEGDNRETLFALYPHQWKHTSHELLDHQYASVRGTMKLGRGTSFETRVPFPGVLPSLPDAGTYDKRQLDRFLDDEARRTESGTKDTYWEGKRLGKLATLIPIAEQTGNTGAASTFRRELRERLENWFTAADSRGCGISTPTPAIPGPRATRSSATGTTTNRRPRR